MNNDAYQGESRYWGPERRGRPTPMSMRAVRAALGLLRLAAFVVVSAAVAGLTIRLVLAQTPQDGYDSLNMAPQGQYWQNRAQGYSEPAGGRYGQPPSYWQGFEPDRAPTYYNEWGQPSTTPDARQYEGVEGVQM